MGIVNNDKVLVEINDKVIPIFSGIFQMRFLINAGGGLSGEGIKGGGEKIEDNPVCPVDVR